MRLSEAGSYLAARWREVMPSRATSSNANWEGSPELKNIIFKIIILIKNFN
jgi:hypothetical protein